MLNFLVIIYHLLHAQKLRLYFTLEKLDKPMATIIPMIKRILTPMMPVIITINIFEFCANMYNYGS